MKVTTGLANWRVVLELVRNPVSVADDEYETGFSSWAEAAARTSGYDAQAIFDKAVHAAGLVRDGQAAFERDTVTFAQRELAYPLFAWLMYVAQRDGALRVLDFGGALGSLYYQHRFLLDELSGLKWGVVEQEHFVDAGRAGFETEALKFFTSPELCVEAIRPNFLLLSSVLQYIEKPYFLLDSLLAYRFPYVLVGRTMARRGMKEEIAVQNVPPSIYEASYPLWLLDADRLEAVFADNGYRVLDNFDPYPGSTFGPATARASYQSWFLRYEGRSA